ncbi:MAG: FAD-binding protein [Cytophagaceae bacterium]|nr:FAD-binding protein [Cytophagaceae bacterium]MDW8456357.1 FAD-binding protein [Cytophagaceae bacterium]
MQKKIELYLSPEAAYNELLLKQEIIKHLQLQDDTNVFFRINKRSIDARSHRVKIRLELIISTEQPLPEPDIHFEYPDVRQKKTVLIAGCGPAGMFAALRLIELGYKPVILERGKDVRSRRRDLAKINKEHIVNPDSNYCFGEGGAGTYSDGKLYTRSKKRGDVRRILEILVFHGAKQDILIDTHPHIGTNKLPNVVANMRQRILNAGGEIHFEKKVTDIELSFGEVKKIITHDGDSFQGIGLILATGHSARDIYELLDRKKIYMQAKPFALGVRIEHPQALIDEIQYHCKDRGPYLPAASYSLVEQIEYNGKKNGVFSFCMCPGGFIVPAATAQKEIVVNGMSPSRRDSPFSNSGIVVAVAPEDLHMYSKYDKFSCLEFQREIEHHAWIAGGSTQTAPAQRMVDFVQKKISTTTLNTSYQPGLRSADMREVLPPFIYEPLAKAFVIFGKKMKGYFTNEAQVIGVESRTSSAVLIPRDKQTLEHIYIKRLFPCGEGAGYAGGIVSAAIDGERCAEKIVELYG